MMSTKFKPEKVPSWVRWIAQDADGWWWGYKYKPVLHTLIWDCKTPYGSDRIELHKSKPPKDFTKQLYSWRYV